MRGWLALTVFLATPAWAQTVPQTEVQMLSGHGSRDAMPWRFRIDSGRGAGRDTVIAVPSNWQQQGFGAYQYGYDKGPRVAGRATYRRSFVVPKQWAGRSVDIVFDGVMTDAQVTVNGVAAGPVHQGGFNRFRYDITQLVKVGGSNDLVVEVAGGAPPRRARHRHRRTTRRLLGVRRYLPACVAGIGPGPGDRSCGDRRAGQRCVER